MKPIQIVQGAQYGSEAKGAIAAFLCQRDNIDFAVRTGATNAGHTVMWRGSPIKMQQLPVGWVNPHTQLVLGAGSMIDLTILKREIAMVSDLTGTDTLRRLTIDYRAYIHDTSAAERARQSDRHHLIGATGKGCSEAVMDKIRLRGLKNLTIGRAAAGRDYPLADTAQLLNTSWDEGGSIQLEGTQGTFLDLHLGPYPYTTHKQTGPAQWMMEAGLSPALPTDIVLVARTFPIRVAGNSGPLPQETSWPTLVRQMNVRLDVNGMSPIVPETALSAFESAVRQVVKQKWSSKVPPGSDGLDQHAWDGDDRMFYRDALSEIHRDALSSLPPDTIADLSAVFELTTVTKKLRRVAELSMSDLRQSVALNRPHQLVITFMNYVFPEYWGSLVPELFPTERDYVNRIEKWLDVPVTYITRGPGPEHIINLGRQID